MKLQYSLLALLAAGLFPGAHQAAAHIGLTGRMFNWTGTGLNTNPIDGGAFSITNQTVSSNFGWADGTDATWGDSHRIRFYKFTLASTQTVDISVIRRNDPLQTGLFDTFLPGFSLFTLGGSFVTSTHDSSPNSTSYLQGLFGTSAVAESYTDSNSSGTWTPGEAFTDTNGNGVWDGAGVGGSGKEGAFQALAPWSIFSDQGTGDRMDFSNLVGHLADGAAANYGSAAGIQGDGLADGMVSKKFFNLPAGDYYLAVGGANYLAQNSEGPTFPTYGADVIVAAPEPTTAALLAFGLLGLATRRTRRLSS